MRSRELESGARSTTGLPASVDAVESVVRGIERLAEQRIEPGRERRRRCPRCRGLVLGGGERQVGLHHLEARRVACVESRLRGVARAVDSRAARAGSRLCVGDAGPRSRRGGRRCEPGRSSPRARPRRRERSPRQRRCACAFTAKLERHGKAKRLLRRLLFDFDGGFRVQPFARDGKVGEVDRPRSIARRRSSHWRQARAPLRPPASTVHLLLTVPGRRRR